MIETDWRRHLADYADGELDAATRAEIEAQLAADAQACEEVRRWQALRAAARHAVLSERLPAGLESRIRAGLHRSRWARVPRTYRLASISGIAAVFVIGFFFWPRGAAATAVKTCDFARVHRHCALETHHDVFQIRGQAAATGLTKLRDGLHQQHALDLSGQDYRLEGGCGCSPCARMKVVHAIYRAGDDPNTIVSAFAISRDMKLCANTGAECPRQNCCHKRDRAYQIGQDNDVTVVSWRGENCSYVLVAKLPSEKLIRLAGNTPVAALPTLDEANCGVALATAGGQ